ncbi:spectrin alpha chain, non-erythrocytic 1-like isoform X2 [Macrobrachium rosenbergii]|uniref:spectrin alpha chain, non-erythrocytic 1-like isoform X2 n=1 Tax=Macrobrachium rosenbergii TaxID=79674 RepID=UPI0034D40AC0
MTNGTNCAAQAKEKGIRLKQAEEESLYNEGMEAVMNKLSAIDRILKGTEVGHDLRSAIIALNKQQNLERDLTNLEQVMSELNEKAENMIREGHFDSDNIDASSLIAKARLNEIKALSDHWRLILEDSLKGYKFIYEADLEFQLLSEYNRLASSKEIATDLSGSRLLMAKHMKLKSEVKSHHPKFEDILEKAKRIIEENNSHKNNIENRVEVLKRVWSDLQENIIKRDHLLGDSLKACNCLADIEDLENLIDNSKFELMNHDGEEVVRAGERKKKRHRGSGSSSSSSNSSQSSKSRPRRSRSHSDGHKEKPSRQRKIKKDKHSRRSSSSSSSSQDRGHTGSKDNRSSERKIKTRGSSSSDRDQSKGPKRESRSRSRSSSDCTKDKRSRDRRRSHSSSSSSPSHGQSPKDTHKKGRSRSRSSHDDDSKDKPKHKHRRSRNRNNSSRSNSGSSSGHIHGPKRKQRKSRSHSRSSSHSRSRSDDRKKSSPSEHRQNEDPISPRRDTSRSRSRSSISSQGRTSDRETCPSQKRRDSPRRGRRRNRKLGKRRKGRGSRSHSSSSSSRSDTSDGSKVLGPEELMVKHRAIDKDIHKYKDSVARITLMADTLGTDNHPDSKQIRDRLQAIAEKLEDLQKELDHNQSRVHQGLELQQYLQEATELEQWIAQHNPSVTSFDFEQDYEHIVSLQIKFDYLKERVSCGCQRFQHCEELARRLMEEGSAYVSQVERRQTKLKRAWDKLLNSIEVTARELKEAGELHLFRRDIADFIIQISEKETVISKEITFDLSTIKAQQLKLTLLEKDLVILGAHIEGVVKTSIRLQTTYQGSKNIEQIVQEENQLMDRWNNLQKKIAKRKEQLALAAERCTLLIQSQNLRDWTQDLQAAIKDQDKPRSVEEALVLKASQEQVKAEIESRKEDFSKVIESGRLIVDSSSSDSESDSSSASSDSDSDNEGKPLSEEVKNEIEELSKEWTELFQEVDNQVRGLEGVKEIVEFDAKIRKILDKIRIKVFLLEIHEDDAVHYLRLYVSDVNKNYDLENIQDLIRRHKVFEKQNDDIEKEVSQVDHEGKELKEKHPQAENHISFKLSEVHEALAMLIQKSEDRRSKLHVAEKIQDFTDQYEELMSWAYQMLIKITAPDLPTSVSGSEFVISRHVQYKTELDNQREKFEKCTESGWVLIKDGALLKDEIKQKVKSLEARGLLLINTWKARIVIYKCNLDVRIYLRDAKELEEWMNDGERILRIEDLGQSVEEVEELIRKHEAFLASIESRSHDLCNITRLTSIEENFQAQKRLESSLMEEGQWMDRKLAQEMEKSTRRIEEEERKREVTKDRRSSSNSSSSSSSRSSDDSEPSRADKQQEEREEKREELESQSKTLDRTVDDTDTTNYGPIEIVVTEFHDVREVDTYPVIPQPNEVADVEFHDAIENDDYPAAEFKDAFADNVGLPASGQEGNHPGETTTNNDTRRTSSSSSSSSSDDPIGFKDASEEHDNSDKKFASAASSGENSGDGKKKKHKKKKKSKKDKKKHKRDCKVM